MVALGVLGLRRAFQGRLDEAEGHDREPRVRRILRDDVFTGQGLFGLGLSKPSRPARGGGALLEESVEIGRRARYAGLRPRDPGARALAQGEHRRVVRRTPQPHCASRTNSGCRGRQRGASLSWRMLRGGGGDLRWRDGTSPRLSRLRRLSGCAPMWSSTHRPDSPGPTETCSSPDPASRGTQDREGVREHPARADAARGTCQTGVARRKPRRGGASVRGGGHGADHLRPRAVHGRGGGVPGRRRRRSRDALGRSSVEHAEGSEMSLEDALAYASRGRGPRNRPTTGWASLTPTEIEVCVTRRRADQPADRRASVRVQEHCQGAPRALFAKLGVSTRAELAAVASKRDL